MGKNKYIIILNYVFLVKFIIIIIYFTINKKYE